MLAPVFPRVLDNSYRGQKAALWILGVVAALKMAMSINSIFNGRFVLGSVDGVPLGSYPAGAVQAVVAIFALWAWAHLLLALLAVLAIVRYRSMTTLVYVLLLSEHLGRKAILKFLPIIRTDTGGASWVNIALLTVMAGGLLLSLRQRPALQVSTAPGSIP